MWVIAFFLLAELSRTSGFIDIPTVPCYDMPGTAGLGVKYALPLYGESTDPNDFDMVFKYCFGRAEIALSMFTTNTYVASVKYVLLQEKNNWPAIYAGIDDISYSTHISTVGRGDTIGFLEEKNYFLYSGGRPVELMSAYVAMQKAIAPYINLVFGLGRGRFVGYGSRSHVFNTDLLVLGDEYTEEEHSAWAFGLFFGGSIKFPFGLELMAEMDGRDANVGMRYNHKYFTATLAMAKVEQMGDVRPFSPRITFGVELHRSFRPMAPRFGSIECVIRDLTSDDVVANALVEIQEKNIRYNATDGTFSLSLPAGNYTVVVSKSDYVTNSAQVTVKPDIKSTYIFNLRKTDEALRREAISKANAATREKARTIEEYLEQGKKYYEQDNLNQAAASFEVVLALDAYNEEAHVYLANIEARRAALELIAQYSYEARSRTRGNEYSKAIEAWEKVLALDPNNAEAKAEILALQTKIAAATKKPPKQTPPPKPKVSKEAIDALYKQGVNLFLEERYNDALTVFKEVLLLEPNHEGAKNYKHRTEVWLEAIRGG
ncbi:MAG: PEGA domain-containing protein [candidate division WOR-3 bacterium]|nr:MAG: PEGA domain-containing protein [candidate division WOR-3 bacterium]